VNVPVTLKKKPQPCQIIVVHFPHNTEITPPPIYKGPGEHWMNSGYPGMQNPCRIIAS